MTVDCTKRKLSDQFNIQLIRILKRAQKKPQGTLAVLSNRWCPASRDASEVRSDQPSLELTHRHQAGLWSLSRSLQSLRSPD